jgi:8-oxo-dGTP diphosphatase
VNRLFFERLEREAKESEIKRYVVGAVVSKDSRILLLRRPQEEFMGGIYELPSGKVEDGESLDSALYREVMEETGLTITRIINYIGYFDYMSGSGRKTRQFNFKVDVAEFDKIKLQEHDEYAWVAETEFRNYPITDSLREILARLQ